MTLHFSLKGTLNHGRQLLFVGLWFLVLSLFTLHSSLFTRPVYAADPPNPQPCQNAVATDNLTDHYITDANGDPPDSNYTFPISGKGVPGSTVTATAPNSITYTLDLSKLQAIFADTNSNFNEGSYQNQDHQQAPLVSLDTQNRDNFFGPDQKAAPAVMTDQLRVKYVNYVYNKPTLAESANTITNVSGQNPMTIYDMVQKWGLPQPGSASWQSTWGPYWVKIPTAYNEYYEGKLEFSAAVGNDWINAVKSGDKCPNPFDSRPPITFIMPNLFRATATTGETNVLIVPKIAQSPENNLMLASAKNVESALASIIQRCVYLASQNPLTKSLKKVISYLDLNKITPVKNAYAATNAGCVKVLGDGKSGTAPYCALPAGQLPTGACTQPNANDPNQLDPNNPNVVCQITFTFSTQMTLPTSGNGQWDNCTYSGGTVSCTATVSVWPDFRIPWIGEVWNNTLYSDSSESIHSVQQTGRPGVYSFFTPDLVLKSAQQPDPLAVLLQGMVDKCQQNPATGPSQPNGCADLMNWAATHNTQYPDLAGCFTNYLKFDGTFNAANLNNCLVSITQNIISSLVKLPGQVGGTLGESISNVLGTSTGEGKQPLIGATDCEKMFVRDMALKPLVLQHYQNIDTSCIPKPNPPTTTPIPTPIPTPGPTPTPTPTPTPVVTPIPTPVPTPTTTPVPTPIPTPTPTPIPSLTFSWGRPPGVADFVDSGGTTARCSSTSTSCSTSTGIFWPGSSLIFAVHANTSVGPVIKSGGATAAANGSASMSWSWTYVALIYPNSFSSCQTAGNQCQIKTINDDSSSLSVTFNNLTPGTTYQETVCTPNCGTGLLWFSRTASTN
jgi:hypothetical protein